MRELCLPLLLGLLLFNVTLFAQPKAKGHPEKLIADPNDYFMKAQWSPDGSQIAFSGDKYNSIWVSDAKGKKAKKVSGDLNSGFGFSWSADGQTLLARSAQIENKHRYHSVKLYDVDNGQQKVLQGPTAGLKQLPVWVDGDSQVAMVVDKTVKTVSSGKATLKSASQNQKKALLFNGALVASNARGEQEVSFSEFNGRHIFNQKTSPSGKKVIFQVNGLGLYVANSDGSGLKHLGRGEQASWMPDERYVVVTLVEDDGQVITQGNLYAVDVETGSYAPVLASQETIALNPSVSPDGSRLLFDNPRDGAIYLLKLSE